MRRDAFSLQIQTMPVFSTVASDALSNDSSHSRPRNPSVDSGFDEFTLKREQRKIKNRAAAQLSRLRRKEVRESRHRAVLIIAIFRWPTMSRASWNTCKHSTTT
jgi:hypothetical protein